MSLPRLLILVAGGCLLSWGAGAEDVLDIQIKALKAITESASSICNTVKTEGSSQSVEVSGDVKAELSGIAKKLADLGISGAGKYTSEKHDMTVLQQDLSNTIKSNSDCRKSVLELLKDKMIPDQPKSGQLVPRVGINVTFGQVGLPGMKMSELHAMGHIGIWEGNQYKIALQKDSLATVNVGYEFDGKTSLVSKVVAFADYSDVTLCNINFQSGVSNLRKSANSNSTRENLTSSSTMLYKNSSLYGRAVLQSLPVSFSYNLTEIRRDGKTYPEKSLPISYEVFNAGKLYSCGLSYLSQVDEGAVKSN
jgi:hypothetical protein